MAYSGYAERKGSMGRRTQEYGYGMDDIQRASERLGRDQAMNTFRTNQQIKNTARSLPGQFNRRGMLDSGLFRRGKEIAAGEAELALTGVESSAEQARRQLDKQRAIMDENLYGGLVDDQIANAMRRFAISQTLQGLI
jgi:hypothetical protein|tara:strand:- start:774 stop:1187 length:414 start_codon:yes stop_codon:yes gene_type:complete